MPGHYFDRSPSGADARRDVTVRVWDRELVLATGAGVFSHDGLDHATRVLLESVDVPQGPGRVLDLGCGWGPIACLLALANPQLEVWAVDVNERALDLTRENARRLGVTVHAAQPDDVPADLRFDAIWSNPPIRIGKPALHALLTTWLDRLAETGSAHLVVGKNLGADSLQTWLAGQGWPTSRVASSKGFRVLRASAR